MVDSNSSGVAAKGIGAAVIILLVLICGVGIYWSDEPNVWDVKAALEKQTSAGNGKVVVGAATTLTIIQLTEMLLDKPGGYITNDVLPPGVFMDNIPNWEFGVLVQLRDMSRALRKDFARSQSTSAEDRDLAKAEPQLHFNNDKFWLPSTEGEYTTALKYLERYQARLSDPTNAQAQFFARSDNLRSWLADVETRLGSLSQRLSASVGKEQLNIDLAGDSAAQRSTGVPSEQTVKTSFFELDDIFYEARGNAFALVHLLKAIEIDFHDVLDKKNALVSVRQIIRELEATQQSIGSPMILNGDGFGMLANHSLVMANYISRANAAIIDLRELLSQG